MNHYDEPILPNPSVPVPDVVKRLLSLKEGECFTCWATAVEHRDLAYKGLGAIARALGWVLSFESVRESKRRGWQVTRCTAEQAERRAVKPSMFAPGLMVTDVTFPVERYEAENQELDEIDADERRVQKAAIGATLRMVCTEERIVARQTAMRRAALQSGKELSFQQTKKRKPRNGAAVLVEFSVTVRDLRKPIRHALPQQAPVVRRS